MYAESVGHWVVGEVDDMMRPGLPPLLDGMTFSSPSCRFDERRFASVGDGCKVGTEGRQKEAGKRGGEENWC